MILFVALQLAASVPRQRLTPKDSAKLVARVRDAEFLYLMDWRHEWEKWRYDVAVEMRDVKPG
ncbi:MAG TPA: hypothetical protein VMH39_07465, partial [Gemmatimonadaceae bacterium]|nr:hypothetical protein [Gemmatimonadaceae bacterium]